MASPTTWQEAAAQATGEISTEMATVTLTQAEMARIVDITIVDLANKMRGGRDIDDRLAFVGLAVLAVNGYQQITGDRDGLDTVRRTVIKKQHDYGHENIARFGLPGLVVRLNDKAARLLNLIGRGSAPAVSNEALSDTWLDVAGYCVLALMWIDDTFLLPLEEDQ